MWHAGANRLTNINSNGVTTTLEYDPAGCITRRYVADGYSDYTYLGNTDWLSRETWHAYSTRNTFDILRYHYTNGRPDYEETTLDREYPGPFTVYYMQYNWHGDGSMWVGLDGNGSNNTSITFDPWGVYGMDPPDYYLWNAGSGYLYFSPLKLYYVHGRWYNPETALWLSPDEKGEYLYGGDGQDPVNYGWITSLSAPGVGGGMPPTLLQGIVAHQVIQSWCFVTFLLDCRTNEWTSRGFADIVLWREHEIYEIKPYTSYGIQAGPPQVARYIDGMKSLYGGNWVEGRTWKLYAFFLLPDGTVLNVTTYYDTYPGMIFYYWSQPIPVYFPRRATERIPVLIPILKPVPVPIMPSVPTMPGPGPIPVTP